MGQGMTTAALGHNGGIIILFRAVCMKLLMTVQAVETMTFPFLLNILIYRRMALAALSNSQLDWFGRIQVCTLWGFLLSRNGDS